MFPSNLKVWVATNPVDMRKGYNGLAYYVQQEFKLNPKDSQLFVFFGKGNDKVKILYWDRNGFALWYKCLADGKFRLPKVGGSKYKMSYSDLNLLLEGIDLSSKQRLASI